MPCRRRCRARFVAAGLVACAAGFAARAGDAPDGDPSIEEMLLAVGVEPPDGQPARPTGAPPPAPAGTDALEAALAELDALVAKGDLAGAKAMALEASRDPRLAASKAVLTAAADLAESLLERVSVMRRRMEAQVGSEVRVRTASGQRKGELAEVSEAGLTLLVKAIINREVKGVTRVSVAWADLTPREQDRLADGWEADDVALAALAFARGDGKAGEDALAAAGNHPLAPHYRARVERKRAAAADRAAEAAWEAIERKARPPLAAKPAGVLLEEIAEFEKAHGATRFAASARERIEAVKSAARGTLGPAAGLVAHWRFDEGRGQVARDSAGANHATMTGAAWVRGRSGPALGFDGVDDFVELPAAATCGLRTFTFSFWVSTSEARAHATYWHRPCLLGQATQGAPSGDLGVNSSAGLVGFWHGLGPSDRQYLSRHTRIGDGAWHHVALAAEASAVRLYVDARHEAFLPTTGMPLNKTPFRVGMEGGTRAAIRRAASSTTSASTPAPSLQSRSAPSRGSTRPQESPTFGRTCPSSSASRRPGRGPFDCSSTRAPAASRASTSSRSTVPTASGTSRSPRAAPSPRRHPASRATTTTRPRT